MDKWINLSLSRHIEFQKKLKIKDEQVKNYANFDFKKDKKYYFDEFQNESNLIASNILFLYLTSLKLPSLSFNFSPLIELC